MKKGSTDNNFVDKILNDKKLQQEWENRYKTQHSDNLSSEEDEKCEKESSVRNKINKLLQSKPKKSDKIEDSVSLLQAQIKRKTAEIVSIKSYCAELTEQNLQSKKHVFDVNAAVREMYIFAKKTFPKIFEDGWFSILQVEKQNPITITKEITKLFYTLSQSMFEKVKLSQNMHKVNEQNVVLSKTNQRLLSYIQQRKTYSEGLKQKINKYKQHVRVLEEQNKNLKTDISLATIEQKLDIKYMNRNDLILLIKNLMQRIKRHSKQCKNQANKIDIEDIQRFCPKDLAQIVKRSDSRNKQTKNRTRQKQTSRKDSKQKANP